MVVKSVMSSHSVVVVKSVELSHCHGSKVCESSHTVMVVKSVRALTLSW